MPLSDASLQLWEYRDMEVAAVRSGDVEPPASVTPAAPPPGFTEEQVTERIQAALEQAEQRWAVAGEQHEARRREQIQATLQAFLAERARYFREVETEVVQLALAIARKVLGREASLDPDLVAALVRIALDRMGAGPEVKVRVPAAELATWQRQAIFAASPFHCELAADESLTAGDCIVETSLGTANFGLDAQFKEIEQGMLDLLRLRPSLLTPNSAESASATPAAFGKIC
jgi:flagellar assembly protein FliH